MHSDDLHKDSPIESSTVPKSRGNTSPYELLLNSILNAVSGAASKKTPATSKYTVS